MNLTTLDSKLKALRNKFPQLAGRAVQMLNDDQLAPDAVQTMAATRQWTQSHPDS